MPMNRSLYPTNWLSKSERAVLTLTVHHIDRNPGNNQPGNLIALCSGCHRRAHRGDRRGMGVQPNQLNLFSEV
jgi:5-methylcytosine-specific restriction endonuclease McrA